MGRTNKDSVRKDLDDLVSLPPIAQPSKDNIASSPHVTPPYQKKNFFKRYPKISTALAVGTVGLLLWGTFGIMKRLSQTNLINLPAETYEVDPYVRTENELQDLTTQVHNFKTGILSGTVTEASYNSLLSQINFKPEYQELTKGLETAWFDGVTLPGYLADLQTARDHLEADDINATNLAIDSLEQRLQEDIGEHPNLLTIQSEITQLRELTIPYSILENRFEALDEMVDDDNLKSALVFSSTLLTDIQLFINQKDYLPAKVLLQEAQSYQLNSIEIPIGEGGLIALKNQAEGGRYEDVLEQFESLYQFLSMSESPELVALALETGSFFFEGYLVPMNRAIVGSIYQDLFPANNFDRAREMTDSMVEEVRAFRQEYNFGILNTFAQELDQLVDSINSAEEEYLRVEALGDVVQTVEMVYALSNAGNYDLAYERFQEAETELLKINTIDAITLRKNMRTFAEANFLRDVLTRAQGSIGELFAEGEVINALQANYNLEKELGKIEDGSEIRSFRDQMVEASGAQRASIISAYSRKIWADTGNHDISLSIRQRSMWTNVDGVPKAVSLFLPGMVAVSPGESHVILGNLLSESYLSDPNRSGYIFNPYMFKNFVIADADGSLRNNEINIIASLFSNLVKRSIGRDVVTYYNWQEGALFGDLDIPEISWESENSFWMAAGLNRYLITFNPENNSIVDIVEEHYGRDWNYFDLGDKDHIEEILTVNPDNWDIDLEDIDGSKEMIDLGRQFGASLAILKFYDAKRLAEAIVAYDGQPGLSTAEINTIERASYELEKIIMPNLRFLSAFNQGTIYPNIEQRQDGLYSIIGSREIELFDGTPCRYGVSPDASRVAIVRMTNEGWYFSDFIVVDIDGRDRVDNSAILNMINQVEDSREGEASCDVIQFVPFEWVDNDTIRANYPRSVSDVCLIDVNRDNQIVYFIDPVYTNKEWTEREIRDEMGANYPGN